MQVKSVAKLIFQPSQSAINLKVILENSGRWQNDSTAFLEGDRNWNMYHLLTNLNELTECPLDIQSSF